MEIIAGIVLFVIGVIVGAIVMRFKMKPKIMGTLRIYSDPDDGPYLFVELSGDPMNVMKEKFVTFDVNPKDYISQK